MDVPSAGRFRGGVLQTARRRERRPLRDRPGAGGAAAEPALRRRHDDRRNPLGQPAGDRLPVPRRRRGPHRSGPGDQRAGQGRGVVRAAARVRPGAGAPARRRRRASRVRHQRADGVAGARRGMGDRPGRHPRNRSRGGRSVTGSGGSRIALRHGGFVRKSGRRGFPPRAGRELLAGLGGNADAARAEPVADEAVGADAARARARRHRRDHGRGDHVAARGDRRCPQLGLPLLLDPGRRDDRGLAGVVGVHRRGRGLSELAARGDRDHARAGAAAPALRAVRRDSRARGRHRLAARLRGLAAGAGRQRRECPSAA